MLGSYEVKRFGKAISLRLLSVHPSFTTFQLRNFYLHGWNLPPANTEGLFPLTPTLFLGGEREIREVIFHRPADKKPGIRVGMPGFSDSLIPVL